MNQLRTLGSSLRKAVSSPKRSCVTESLVLILLIVLVIGGSIASRLQTFWWRNQGGIALAQAHGLSEEQSLRRARRAVREFDRVLSVDSNHLYHLHRAQAYYLLGEIDKAILDFQRVEEAIPYIAAQGNSATTQGDYSRAESLYRLAFAVDQDAQWLYCPLGLVYEAQDRYDKALQSYLVFAQLEQDEVRLVKEAKDCLYRAGRLLQARGEDLRAVPYLRQSIELGGGVLPLVFLSDAYRRLEDFEQAISWAERAVSEYPDLEQPHLYLGLACRDSGLPSAALRQFLIAAEINPQNDVAHFLLGQAYEATGQSQEALQEYQKAVDISPEKVGAHLALAGLYRKLGHDRLALAECRIVLQLEPADDRAKWCRSELEK